MSSRREGDINSVMNGGCTQFFINDRLVSARSTLSRTQFFTNDKFVLAHSTLSPSLCLSVSPSPYLPISLSAHLPIFPSSSLLFFSPSSLLLIFPPLHFPSLSLEVGEMGRRGDEARKEFFLSQSVLA